MKSKQLSKINIDGINNLLLEFAKAQTEREFTEEEEYGIVKFLAYLIDKWEEDIYVN